MSEPDLLPDVLPAAENSAPVSAIRDRQRPMVNATCSVRHCRFTSWSDFFCTYPDHGSSPCADIGSCRHFTIPPGCHAVTPAMRSAVLSALSCFQCTDKRYRKSGVSYWMSVKWCRGWRLLTFPQQLQSFRMLRREYVNATSRAIFMPASIFSTLMQSDFHHSILTDCRVVLGHHHSFPFLF